MMKCFVLVVFVLLFSSSCLLQVAISQEATITAPYDFYQQKLLPKLTPEQKAETAKDLAAWRNLSPEALLSTTANLFQASGRDRLEITHRSSTARLVAAEMLATGNAMQADPATVGQLYVLGDRWLTSPARVAVRARFISEGAWSQLPVAEFAQQAEATLALGKGGNAFLQVAARELAAKQLLTGQAVTAAPLLVNQLYEIGLPSLSGGFSGERVEVQKRFLAEGAWNNLSTTEFLQQAEAAKGKPFLAGMSKRFAAQKLLADDGLEQETSATLKTLYALRSGQLDHSQRELLQKLLVELVRLSNDASFTELQDLYELTGLGRATLETFVKRRQLVAQWLNNQDIATLSTEKLDWCLIKLRSIFPFDSSTGVKVTWQGKLTPERTGEYRFFISPLDLSFRSRDRFHRQAMRVWIDEQLVIDAQPGDDTTAEDWQSESEAINLRKGAPAALKVEFELAFSDREWDANLAVPILAWKGPGIAKTIVPTAVLQAPSGEAGVKASYAWAFEGKPQSATGIEPNIEAAWHGRPLLGYENRSLREQLAAELASRTMSASVLAECKPGDSHPLCSTNEKRRRNFLCLEAMNCAGRAECIGQMCQSSHHWAGVNEVWHLLYMYRLARAGAEEDALDLILAWAAANPNYQLFNYEEEPERILHRRQACRGAGAIFLLAEHEGSLERLEDEGLEDDNGNCNLPIACMLGYGYQVQGKILEWIELLDEKLADESVAGDRRVNWLIARAMAEEIRRSTTNRHVVSYEQFDAGCGWLDEAMLIADSEKARLRVLGEITSRQALLGQVEQAWQRLAEEQPNYNSAENQQVFQQWNTGIEQLAQTRLERQEQDAQAAQAAYLAELKRRQKKAADRGDTASAERYSTAIEATEVQQ